jgi:Calcineurin-like phosphoesterase superfamily domain
MKILLASDIHDNLVAVERMRTQETNQFDAVLIAGDIGSYKAQEIFDVFSSFECPVLYVYGNWDYKLEYEMSFGANCHHLHLSPFSVGDIAFVGFSGCTANWGRNPFAVHLRQEIDSQHPGIVSELSAGRSHQDQAKSVIEAEYASALEELMVSCRRKPSRAKIAVLDERRRVKLSAIVDDVAKLKESEAFSRYENDLSRVTVAAQNLNRAALADLIKGTDRQVSRTVVVTHDRLSKTQEGFCGVPVFLFGHRHGFNETNFQGAQYVNVSVLDNRLLLRSRAIVGARRKREFKNLNTGNYGVMEWTPQLGFTFRRANLEIDPSWQDEWEVEEDFQKPGAPFLA